jgi:hypothetical protein
MKGLGNGGGGSGGGATLCELDDVDDDALDAAHCPSSWTYEYWKWRSKLRERVEGVKKTERLA